MVDLKNAPRRLDKHTVVWEREFSQPLETVWELISTRAGLSQWFMATAHEIEAGGKFAFEGGWDGTISELQPGQHILFTPKNATTAFLRFEISEIRGGCLFKLIDRMGPDQDAGELMPEAPTDMKYQPGGPGTHWSGVLAGYHGFIDELEGVLAGKSLDIDYDQLCRQYMQLLDEWVGNSTDS